jgi:hypothetical protein
MKLDLEIQQEGNEEGIENINKIYNWIQHFLMPNFRPLWPKKTRHQIVHVNYYFNFILTCTNIRNFNLILRDFTNFYTLVCFNLTLKDCA